MVQEQSTSLENLFQTLFCWILWSKMDGVETCRLLRDSPELQKMFVVFLTARSEEYSEVAAFDIGADDYITKPIKPRALMSRISALFRRDSKKSSPSNIITIGDLTIDRTSYTISVKGKEINLPKKEFELLYFLAQNPNKVFSRRTASKYLGFRCLRSSQNGRRAYS